MTNFELIDNYLTNRLNAQEREAFEQQMKSDPALKADVEFQTSIVEGLKKARVAELKGMLNKVPVTNTPAVQFSALKIAAGLVGTAVLVSAIYLYFQSNNQPELPNPSSPIEDSIKEKEQPKVEIKTLDKITQEEQSTESNKKEGYKEPSVKPTQKSTPSKDVNKPKLDVVDPSEDLTESTPTRESIEPSKPGFATPAMEVEIDSTNKKYSFHYQFVSGKVILFGSFDKSLYEILEIHGEAHSTFLFYKDNYFSLDESKNEVTPLVVIKDISLIKKLKEYRNQ